MQQTIKIEIKNIYGELKAYPKCSKASAFARIAGTKTLTRTVLNEVLAMGFIVEEIDRHGNTARRYNPLDAGYSSTLPMVA